MQSTGSNKNKIVAICNQGYHLDFGTIFESAFENYKKIVLYAGLMLLVFSILFGLTLFTGLISYFGIENIKEYLNKFILLSQLKVMPLDFAIPFNTGIILISLIISPFMAGFFKMTDCGEKGEEFNISDMFSYYKFPYVLNIFLTSFIIELLSTGLLLFFQNQGLNFIGSLINLLVSFLTFLTIPIIVFAKLNAIDAVKYSILLVSKQPLPLLGLIIIAGIGAILGLLVFFIGIFFTYPFIYSMKYVIYKSIIKIDESSEIVEISGVKN